MKDRVIALATAAVFFVSLLLVLVESSSAQAVRLPNPVLVFQAAEPYSTATGQFIRYKYFVFNSGDYPAQMFAASPALPPCGSNANSSRTWVDLFTQSGKRLYGFCALGAPDKLDTIWFALPATEIPPSYIYIEMNDRGTNTKYKSNLADTVM